MPWQILKTQKPSTFTPYPVVPGITFIYNQVTEMQIKEDQPPDPNIIEINHCCRGRFECDFHNQQTACLREGDFAINPLKNLPKSYCFPFGQYEGISILIDRNLVHNTVTLPNGLKINFEELWQRLCPGKHCFLLHNDSYIQSLFLPLYTMSPQLRKKLHYFIYGSLLTYLHDSSTLPKQTPVKYLPTKQVGRMKEVEKHLKSHIQKRITIQELAEQFEISPTALKNQFHAVFGKPIFTYMQEYRVQAAAALLTDTSFPISDIALQVGYSSTSKFIAAFRKYYGSTPSAYRRGGY